MLSFVLYHARAGLIVANAEQAANQLDEATAFSAVGVQAD
jgi:hypothetical protein